jgi:hypothetical protein
MQYRALSAVLAAGLMLWAAPAAAQEPDMAAMMEAWQKAGQPGVQHEQLAAYVGSWEGESKMWMDPAGEPTVSTVEIQYEMIMDGRYLSETMKSDFMGQAFKGHGLYAFNNLTGKVQAIWIDNTASGIYMYGGSLNEAGDEIVLSGKYMDPMTNEWKETRSVMRISGDQLHYVGYEMMEGEKIKTMEITATRKSM